MPKTSASLVEEKPSPAAESPALTGERLGQVLSIFGTVIESRTSIPALGCILLEANGKTLTLEGTDLDQKLTCTLPYEGPAFSKLVNHRSLSAAVAAFGKEEPGLFSTDQRLFVRGAAGEFEILALPTDDFPHLLRVAPDAILEARLDILQRALKACRPAISQEETRYYLMGISLKLDSGRLELASTDGHRLHLAHCPLLAADADMPQVILRSRSVKCLLAIMEGEPADSSIIVEVAKLRGCFSLGEWTLETKFIDGTYPDYRRILPDVSVGTLAFQSDDLASRLKTIRRLNNDTIKGAVLDPGACTVKISSPEGFVFSGHFPGHPEGQVPSTIGFNARYAVEILDTHPKSNAIISFGAEAAMPFTFKFDGDDDFTAVLMPMRV